jgi:hypothetical protein
MRDKIASFISVGKKLTNGRKWLMGAGLLTLCATASAVMIPNLFPFLDPTGLISTYNAAGAIDQSSKNAFSKAWGPMAAPAALAICPTTPWASVLIAFRPNSSSLTATTPFSPLSTVLTVQITPQTIPPPTVSS